MEAPRVDLLMCLVLRAYFSPLLRAGLACGSLALPGPVSGSVLALQGLMHSSGPVGRHRQLVLVLEGELYLIPFALLKGSSSNEYLYERFALIAVPSIRALSPHSKVRLWQACGCHALRSARCLWPDWGLK